MLKIADYVIDVELSATPTFENEATSYPTEAGVDFTDHVRSLPTGLNVEGIVSDTPVDSFVVTQREIDGETGGETPSRSAYTRLLEIHQRKEPVTVTCSLGTFDDMVMLTFEPKRVGGSIQFTASFRFLNIIENERTMVRVAVPRAANKDKIKKPATFLESDRNNEQHINRVIVPAGTHKGTSMYVYDETHPDPSKRGKLVEDEVINKTIKDTGAVRVKYVNGQAVPYDDKDYQPYVTKSRYQKERPWWPDDDNVQLPLTDKQANPNALPGLGRGNF